MFSSEEIKEQLKKLLILKRNGELDTKEKLLLSNDEYWRDSITYDCLEDYIYHQDEEVLIEIIKVNDFKFHINILI